MTVVCFLLVPEKSCSAIKKMRPDSRSGLYYINPKDQCGKAFRVFCNMTSMNGVGVTEIGHNSEIRTIVDGKEDPGSYSRKIVYKTKLTNVDALIDISARCQQSIEYECYGSTLHEGSTDYAWWVSREGEKINYWGGATGHKGKCGCALTNSCAGGETCNCDKNDYVLRNDTGYLTDKNALPVMELHFGDTGRADGRNEYGYHTLGKLLCWG